MKTSMDRVEGLLNVITINRNNSIGVTIVALLFTDLPLACGFLQRMYGIMYTESELNAVINLLEQEGRWN